MKQRGVGQAHRIPRQARVQGAAQHGVMDHAVVVHDPLGPSRGAGGVQQAVQIVAGELWHDRLRLMTGNQPLVIRLAALAADQQRPVIPALGQRRVFLVAEHNLRLAVRKKLRDLHRVQPPVQRHEQRAQFPAGEHEFVEVGAVGGDDGHPVALAHAVPGRQPRGQARASFVDFGVGESPACAEVHAGGRVGVVAGVVGQPVVDPVAAQLALRMRWPAPARGKKR